LPVISVAGGPASYKSISCISCCYAIACAAAMDHKADDSQVIVIVFAVALFLMSLLEVILEESPVVLLKCADCSCVGLWQRSKKDTVK
jgi:hypothetical protein